MPIRILPSQLIYQIASGEVIDRPSSIVKELLENAIDAQASSIWMMLHNGGESYISVKDNGTGMCLKDIELAVKHHTTSKLTADNLENIQTLGFRGEALPSISFVSRMSITSKCKEDEWGWFVQFEDQSIANFKPFICTTGTHVEVRDLFYKTPNRLKFLKTPEWEFQGILNVFKRLAMAYPSITFNLNNDKKTLINFLATSFEERIEDVLGEAFKDNSLMVEGKKDYIRLRGLISLPSFTQSTANFQYLFVNGRSINNKLLSSAIRVAYEGLLFRNRYPMVALFLDIPGEYVDVNIHPKKYEVKFKEAELVKETIKDILKETLTKTKFSVSTSFGEETFNSFESGDFSNIVPFSKKSLREEFTRKNKGYLSLNDSPDVSYRKYPLGQAIGQIYNTYIVSEGEEKFFIIDQHAAHERILYEEIKDSLKGRGLKITPLNPPLTLKFDSEKRFDVLVKYQEELKLFGLNINFKAYPELLTIEGVPEILGEINVESLVSDLIEEIIEFGEPLRLSEHVHQICSTLSCHLSIRGGEKLNPYELNKLLRQIEKVNYSGQCNHGRPTYLSLRKKDLERIFRRSS